MCPLNRFLNQRLHVAKNTHVYSPFHFQRRTFRFPRSRAMAPERRPAESRQNVGAILAANYTLIQGDQPNFIYRETETRSRVWWYDTNMDTVSLKAHVFTNNWSYINVCCCGMEADVSEKDTSTPHQINSTLKLRKYVCLWPFKFYLAQFICQQVSQQESIGGVSHQVAIFAHDFDFLYLVAIIGLQDHPGSCREIPHDHLEEEGGEDCDIRMENKIRHMKLVS